MSSTRGKACSGAITPSSLSRDCDSGAAGINTRWVEKLQKGNTVTQTPKTTFSSGRETGLAVKRVVQRYRTDRSDIFAPKGEANSDNELVSRPDRRSGASIWHLDPALAGRIKGLVDLQNDAPVTVVKNGISEMGRLHA